MVHILARASYQAEHPRWRPRPRGDLAAPDAGPCDGRPGRPAAAHDRPSSMYVCTRPYAPGLCTAVRRPPGARRRRVRPPARGTPGASGRHPWPDDDTARHAWHPLPAPPLARRGRAPSGRPGQAGHRVADSGQDRPFPACHAAVLPGGRRRVPAPRAAV